MRAIVSSIGVYMVNNMLGCRWLSQESIGNNAMYSFAANNHISSLFISFSECPNIIFPHSFAYARMAQYCPIVTDRIGFTFVSAIFNLLIIIQ